MIHGFKDASSCWKAILSDVNKNSSLLSGIEHFARENMEPCKVVFGTSGWRGEIGTDFTFNNLRVVTTAIVEMFKGEEPSVMKAIGVSGYEDIKKRGVVVGHDNRYLGRQFAMEVIGILQNDGIKAWYAGEAPTPQYSAGIEMLGAACSINLTPSHNPANYAGFKLNPADGGPAGTEITSVIEDIANRMMRDSVHLPSYLPDKVSNVDLTDLYIKYLVSRKTIDLARIKNFINRSDCCICVDNVHGSTRNCIQRIIGESANIKYMRTGDDYLFGGVAPEPSETNMAAIDAFLRSSHARFKLGVIMDPDGDRIRHSDGTVQMPMNYFGAVALHYLHVHRGIQGIVAKSVGTSNFVNAIAEELGISVRETKVGFKNFRPYLLQSSDERAIVAFEESDGISGFNHTLEKDALFGFLLSVEIMAATGLNLGEYLKELMDVYGYYYPDRSGISVDKSLVGKPLLDKLATISGRYSPGSKVDICGQLRTVTDVITADGIKLIFDDASWLMIRPSGTEPKVRFYIEARTEGAKTAVFDTAEKITREALN
ncbi:MAG TPA: phosphomannomutase [Dissulfurispiraceae bacterium]|nr:phosphomannomutase [Dissulfurispiraceae bacterium]